MFFPPGVYSHRLLCTRPPLLLFSFLPSAPARTYYLFVHFPGDDDEKVPSPTGAVGPGWGFCVVTPAQPFRFGNYLRRQVKSAAQSVRGAEESLSDRILTRANK